MNIFVLHHVNEMATGEAKVKLIGIYSSQAIAERTIERLCHKPGFCKSMNGFYVDCYTLDEDDWAEGFIVA